MAQISKFITCSVLAVSGLMLLHGCAGTSGPKAGALPAPPATDDAYTELPFKKIITPAFADDVAGKFAHFKLKFVNTDEFTSTLPPAYQEGWVKFAATDPDDMSVMSINIVVKKENSSALFDLKSMDIIDVFAYLDPIEETNAITGRSGKKILIVVEKYKKL